MAIDIKDIIGSALPIGFTGSQGVIGFTGSRGAYDAIGFTGSQGVIGFTGSNGAAFAAGSSGQITYNNGGTPAGAAQLYYDTTNNYLGLGTSTPNLPGATLGKVIHVHHTDTGPSLIHLTNSTTGDTSTDGVVIGKLNNGTSTLLSYEQEPLTIGTNGLTRMQIAANAYEAHINNPTSGLASIAAEWTFRRTANGAAIGATIADVFTTPSSLSLEASSVYEISGILYFSKTTAGTALWTNTFSSAPVLFVMQSTQSPVTGMTSSTGGTHTTLPLSFFAQNVTTAASAATGSLTSAVNHYFSFRGQLITNAATNWRLRLTQSAGTATPLAGSYYTIKKIATSTGTFVA